MRACERARERVRRLQVQARRPSAAEQPRAAHRHRRRAHSAKSRGSVFMASVVHLAMHRRRATRRFSVMRVEGASEARDGYRYWRADRASRRANRRRLSPSPSQHSAKSIHVAPCERRLVSPCNIVQPARFSVMRKRNSPVYARRLLVVPTAKDRVAVRASELLIAFVSWRHSANSSRRLPRRVESLSVRRARHRATRRFLCDAWGVREKPATTTVLG